MPEDPAWANDELICALSDFSDIRSTNEHAEGIVLLGDAPRAITDLRKVHLTVPTRHEQILSSTADALEPQLLPKRKGGLQIIARDCGKGANRRLFSRIKDPCFEEKGLSRPITAVSKLANPIRVFSEV